MAPPKTNALGGPRFAKTSMVINVPFLQQGFCEIGAEVLNLNISNSNQHLWFIEHLCLESPNFTKPRNVKLFIADFANFAIIPF